MLKKQPPEDWKWIYIKFALAEAGWTLTGLSKKHGYESRCALKKVKTVHWLKAEKIIADALNTTPQTIWPSRYPDQTDCTSECKR